MNILYIFILILLSFFPIVLWAYSFAFISDNPLNKKRFFMGIIGGVLSVFSILYIDKIIDFLNAPYLNVFFYISEIKGIVSSLNFGISLGLFLGIIVIISLIVGLFLLKNLEILKIYGKNFLLFLFFILGLTIFLFIWSQIPEFFFINIKDAPVYSGIVFGSFKLVVFYYIVVAFVEEASKHFNFLQTSAFQIDSIKTGVECAIFIALGFSFIENIMYLNSILQEIGLSALLVKVYFFRSVFSVIVHVTCSAVVSYFFSKAYLTFKQQGKNFPFFKVFFLGLFISILLHVVFDVALTLGFSFVLFLYFIGGYLYVSSIFYK